jgi:fumarate hydratase class II
MKLTSNVEVTNVRKEADSLGEVDVPSAKLWGAQTQSARSNISALGKT